MAREKQGDERYTAGAVRVRARFTEIELTRQAEVRRALEADYDEIAAVEQEELAYARLFADLDDHQRAVHAELVRAGVLPAREGDVDAA